MGRTPRCTASSLEVDTYDPEPDCRAGCPSPTRVSSRMRRPNTNAAVAHHDPGFGSFLPHTAVPQCEANWVRFVFVSVKNHPPGVVFWHFFPHFCLVFAKRTQLVFYPTYSCRNSSAFFCWVRLVKTLFSIESQAAGSGATQFREAESQRPSRAGASECNSHPTILWHGLPTVT